MLLQTSKTSQCLYSVVHNLLALQTLNVYNQCFWDRGTLFLSRYQSSGPEKICRLSTFSCTADLTSTRIDPFDRVTYTKKDNYLSKLLSIHLTLLRCLDVDQYRQLNSLR